MSNSDLNKITPFPMSEDPAYQALSFSAYNNFATMFGTKNSEVPAYFSKARDTYLRECLRKSDILATIAFTLISKIMSMDIRVLPEKRNVLTQIENAKNFRTKLLTNSGTKPFKPELSKFLLDTLTTDNGGFLLVMGRPFSADKPLVGQPFGLLHLDSLYCFRTNNDNFPVIYQSPITGKNYRVHKSRLISFVDFPQSDFHKFGTGFCSVSRALDVIRVLQGIVNYQMETLGVKPPKQILFGSSITTKEILDAIAIADFTKDVGTLSKTLVIGGGNSGAKLDLIKMSTGFENFDTTELYNLTIYLVALAFGLDAKSELNIALTSSGSTKADALLNHFNSRQRSFGLIIESLESQISDKFLPKDYSLKFNIEDGASDRASAEIAERRSVQRARDIQSGSISKRTARMQMYEEDELSKSDFVEDELADGRLEDGTPIEALLFVDEEPFKTLFDFGSIKPLSYTKNDPEEMIGILEEKLSEAFNGFVNSRTEMRIKYRAAIFLIQKLLKEYGEEKEEEEEEINVRLDRPSETAMRLNNEDTAMQEE
jgi:hypothetical protein